MKYFSNIKTLDEPKKEYRRLLMQHHPDKGGNTATIKSKACILSFRPVLY